MVILSDYLIFSAFLLVIGLTGIFINRRNIILLLMCIEIILLSVNTSFISFSKYMDNLSGQIFVFFILTVAAVEAAIGLAILVTLFRNKKTVDVEKINVLKE